MASIDFIQKRIEGKKKELEKLHKKLERINKAKESGWTENPYYYREDDIKYTLRDIENAEKLLSDYEKQLESEKEKAESRNVTMILDFLEKWKARVYAYYKTGLTQYFDEKHSVYKAYTDIAKFDYGTAEYDKAKALHEELYAKFHIKCYGEYKKEPYTNRWGKTAYREIKISDGEYEYLSPYRNESDLEQALAKLEKDLIREAERKYDFIIERTNAIVGKITDASGLTIGAKDDLNGFIKGTKGIAKVKTIGAGGHNIQCFHFRTLISEQKS